MFVAVEGVHFNVNVLDTNDIQTIRGGAMLLESLAGALAEHLRDFGPGIITFGASRAVLDVAGADRAALDTALRAFCASEPWCFMSLRHGYGDTPKQALRAIRPTIYKDWTIPPSYPQSARVPDCLDHARPGTERDIGPDGTPRQMSRRNLLFRQTGSAARPEFRMSPPQSMEQIIADPPEAIPVQARGKIALVYADGSGFGALGSRIRASDGDAGFSGFLQARRAGLARAIEDWLETRGAYGMRAGHARFDVLIWGGDDITFVMPAWLLFGFLDRFFAEVDGWGDAHGVRITHRVSAVIANHKSPIRQLRALAYGGQELLKEAGDGGSMFSVDVFESIAPAFDSLLSYRRALYGGDYRVAMDAFFAADAASAAQFMREKVGPDDAGGRLAITQLHRLLEKLGTAHRLCSDAADGAMVEMARAYWARVHGETEKDLTEWRSGLGRPRSLPMSFAQIAQLYPYVQPEAQQV